MLTLLILLLVGHALADYPLQGDFLAKAKFGTIPGIPGWYALATHSVIHAGFVLWFTDSVILAGVEFVAHYIIDTLKINNRINFMVDQALHIACKLGYVAVVLYVPA
jgi:hypothetical protein